MKTVAIGDIHGRTIWKDIVAKESADKVVFIGDYFDSYDDYTAAEQMHNFKEIIEFKESGESEVILLIGNHCKHYIDGSEHYSGYQAGAAAAINDLFHNNLHHLQMCYQMDEFLFSHAGVSHDWLELHSKEYKDNNDADVAQIVNDLWEFTPRAFKFAGWDPYGDSVISSPIWIRPRSLIVSNRETLRDRFIQVVGHTQVKRMDREGNATGGRYHLIDTLGTSREYLIIEDDEVKFGTI